MYTNIHNALLINCFSVKNKGEPARKPGTYFAIIVNDLVTDINSLNKGISTVDTSVSYCL